ncbi:CaiB/BaiF CoA transferase family protein [Marinivivus vitaminiproducens]|uniref:CaiB/BaiF CoA transferase family protein n=1 Tax=Marinivivus vitaminiproducens TaxID=3035935 RepID=UPI0027A29FC6|nr:CoA transferase [Geminicoccaceae bacterium SCSIO 64248]
MTQPLDGIRVVDLTRILSGPFCSMLLADMGADVIKIEPPGTGDPVRGQGAGRDGLSWYFAGFNRNKRSVTLDLKSAEGRAVLARLIESADVLVENYRPGILAKMGFDAERLEALNPRLIVASVNGYGSTGPYVDRPAFDFIAQAMSGFMSVNGEPDGVPLRSAPPLTDLVAGLYTAFGVVNALRARELTGRGQCVEASMTNGIMSLFAYLASDYLATGQLPNRTGNDHPIASPYGLFTCKDGQVAVAPSTNVILRRFFAVLGLPDPLSDPELDTMEKRVAHRARLNRMIDERMREETQDVWIERLNAAGVPCGRVQDLSEAFADPQVLAQEMVLDVPHPGRGVVRMLGFPVKFSDTPCRVRHPTPELGADVDAVLGEIGYDEATICDFRDRAIV